MRGIGIMGYGVVGSALATVLSTEGYDVGVYDPFKDRRDLSVLAGKEIVFVCVWTPMKDGGLDASYVNGAVSELRPLQVPLIAVRSTLPPGVMTTLENTYPYQCFAFAPEFLVEADPVGSTRRADRIVIGSNRRGPSVDRLAEVLRAVSPGSPVVRTSLEEAVMVKLASNALLASKVAVANELYDICEGYGVSWDNVRGAVGLDRRISPDHLRVTEERGYGGSCFPKDIQGLIGAARDVDQQAPILTAIQHRNTEIRTEPEVV